MFVIKDRISLEFCPLLIIIDFRYDEKERRGDE